MAHTGTACIARTRGPLFTEIAAGVYIQPSLLYQTQTVVIRGNGSVTVVDPNYFPHEILAARELAERLGTPQEERLLALTHSDFDHIAGAPWFTDFRSLTHATWDLENEERSRAALETFDQEHYIPRARTLTAPIRRDISVSRDGEQHAGFRCYHATGHTRDGLMLLHEATRVLVVGDYLSALEFPFVYVSVEAYRQTLRRIGDLLRETPPRVLISQHGPVAFGEQAARERLRESERYILGLEEAARQDPLATPETLAQGTLQLWGDGIPPALHPRHLENARIALLEAGRP